MPSRALYDEMTGEIKVIYSATRDELLDEQNVPTGHNTLDLAEGEDENVRRSPLKWRVDPLRGKLEIK